jgi:hypothetical protein
MVEVTAWSNGRDPEEFGWVFGKLGPQVDAYTLSYETPDREAALGYGVPAELLDQYEASDWADPSEWLTMGYGFGLVVWLQDNV